MAKAKAEATETPVEATLKALYTVQTIDSQIDKLKQVRGELPLEVQDLEDEVAGLQTRVEKLTDEVEGLKIELTNKKNTITDAQNLIKKYKVSC